MITTEFILTSLVIVLIPGTGVFYTVSMGLLSGRKASLFAAFGCTLGIIPHLSASLIGLAMLLHISALAFQIVKLMGVLYLFYLAWSMWKTADLLTTHKWKNKPINHWQVLIKGFLISILNPKLSLFFIAFIPQFLTTDSQSPVFQMVLLSAIFMGMTLFVFILYGLCMHYIRGYLLHSPKIMQRVQRSFAAFFILLGIKLAWIEH